jgi:hypothetical protein
MGLNRALLASAPLVIAWAFNTGCTVNAASTTQCSVDAAVNCPGSVGYSCDGAVTPMQNDSSLTCGAGVSEADGDIGYCCAAQASSGCTIDNSAGCTNGSTGYSCTGAETPTTSDPTLACGAGVSDTNGNALYCCIAAPANTSCAPDASVAGCTGGSYGFSCTSTDTPTDGNAALNCSVPSPGDNGSSLYCCVGFTQGTSSCTADSSVVGCTGSSFGFSCTSTDTPDQAQTSLTCSTPAAGPNNEMLYCCSNN